MKLSSITFSRLIHAAKMLVVSPIAVWNKKKHSNIWIITERPDQARDNGYCFYKYVKENHPEQELYYIIDRNSGDYKKIRSYGEAIQFNSWKHYYYYCLSSVHISAHVGGCTPTDNPFAKYLRNYLSFIDVFLPHGVSYGISEFCLEKYAKIDLFICSGKPEYDNVLANYGYTKDQVALTGFPRLDGWHHIKVNPKQIVLMPTWRLYLAQNPNTVFEETNYYRSYQDFINSKELGGFLVENDLQLIFYLHHGMRKYVDSFKTNCSNITVVYKDDAYDIQELLKESALLITDYSSVHFDFAYMEKPVLYYQFDREEFWEKQYQQTEFDAIKDGFGPVAYDMDELIDNLRNAYEDGFQLQGIYEERMKQFYVLRDEHNCERVYKEIMKRIAKSHS